MFDTNTNGILTKQNMSWPKTTAKGIGTPMNRRAGVIVPIRAIINENIFVKVQNFDKGFQTQIVAASKVAAT
jgi:phage terminase large subunit-like protein